MASDGLQKTPLMHYSHRKIHVCFWHLMDIPAVPEFVRNWSKDGQRSIIAEDGLFAFDPYRTFQKKKRA
jgi:hypothetical protein